MTVAEYLRTPETLSPQELIYGAVRVAEAPLPRHQRAVAHLFRALDEHVVRHGLGEMWLSPIDVILDVDRHLIVQPDLLFISRARSDIVSDRIRGAPDLVIEVLSPRPRIGSIEERPGWFARYGVGECWIVELLSRHVDVLTFESGAEIRRESFDQRTPIQSTVLPAFSQTISGILGW